MEGDLVNNTVSANQQRQREVCSDIERKLLESGIWKSGFIRTHLVSPEPFYLSSEQVEELEHLGKAIYAFYQAANKLYNHK